MGFLKNNHRFGNSGFAFVWVMFLIGTMSALALAFHQKLSLGTAATGSRGRAMQAHYLARSAANHAMWRLLNEPGFPASESVYYMHDFDGDRYGYKVKKPTMTTFGTVATVGAVGSEVAKQSYVHYLKPYNIITTYDPWGGAEIPKYRRLLGADWVAPADTLNLGPSDTQYMVLKGFPVRKEMIMGSLDSANDINFAVWDGSAWGNLTEFTDDTGTFTEKCFDIAYESQSGDALVVSRVDSTTAIQYNIWKGSAWEHETLQDAPGTAGGTLTFITMASHPSSDEILIAAVNSQSDLKVIQWDGDSFNDNDPEEIETDMNVDSYGSAAVVYEQQSGHALVLWSNSGEYELYYAVWNGTSLSAVSQTPNLGDKWLKAIRAAPDPASDHIAIAVKNGTSTIFLAIWDGNAWTDSRTLTTAANNDDEQTFDVAWEQTGEDVMFAYSPETGNNVRYLTWRQGTALADHTVQTGPDLGNLVSRVRLHPIAGTEKIILLARNTSNDLKYSLWTGSAFSGDPAIMLESGLGLGPLPFDVAESGDAPTGPPSNVAPTVSAGDDQTIVISAQANLDGMAVDDGLPDPPAAFTTTWSKFSGPEAGNVTFGDDSQIDTTADFSEAGEYVLRLTADDSELTASDDVTVIVLPSDAYIETNQIFTTTAYGEWQAVDLSGGLYNVPADVVLEVAVRNTKDNGELWGGVRAFGSGLDRWFQLHEPEGGGVDTVVMHVQADGNSQIKCYAESDMVNFQLLGYWTSGTYVEKFESSPALVQASWEDYSLNTHGVGSGQVAEIVIVNTAGNSAQSGGLRTDGSDLDRIVPLHEAEAGGVDAATMLVRARANPEATIEYWADSNNIVFYLVGFWSVSPGTYTQTFVDTLGSPSSDETWEDRDLSGFGVPADAVVQIAMANQQHLGAYYMGLREIGSSLDRLIMLQEAEPDGGDVATLHVNADENSTIKWRHQDVSQSHNFYLLGYWELPAP